MKPHWLFQPITKSWLTQTRPPSLLDRPFAVLIGVFLPLSAACIQSVWVFGVKDIRLYQAMIGGEAEIAKSIVLAVQAVISVCALWRLIRFPVLQRLAALLLFCGWVYLAFKMNSYVCH
jgi:hypothetical protein